MKLSGIHIYPVKSCRGLTLGSAQLKPRGLKYDRRWMIVDKTGRFISQRSHSILAQLRALPDDKGLELMFGGKNLRAVSPPKERQDVIVWGSVVSALVADDAVNAALSDWLGEDVRLVFMDAQAKRPTSIDWAAGHETSFSDGYPVLVTNTASLARVNDYIKAAGHAPVGMERFRPNIVIETDMPWAEDGWQTLRVGAAVLELVKPCTRCIVTTLDPLSGKAQPEPVLGALRELRMSRDPRNKGVLFGVNAVVKQSGKVALGADVTEG